MLRNIYYHQITRKQQQQQQQQSSERGEYNHGFELEERKVKKTMIHQLNSEKEEYHQQSPNSDTDTNNSDSNDETWGYFVDCISIEEENTAPLLHIINLTNSSTENDTSDNNGSIGYGNFVDFFKGRVGFTRSPESMIRIRNKTYYYDDRSKGPVTSSTTTTTVQ